MANESPREGRSVRIRWRIWLLHKAKWQQHASKGAEARLRELHVACGMASAAKRKAQFAVLQVNSISI